MASVAIPVPDLGEVGPAVVPYLPSVGVPVLLTLAYWAYYLDRTRPHLRANLADRLWRLVDNPKTATLALTAVVAAWCRAFQYTRDWSAAHDGASLWDPNAKVPGEILLVFLGLTIGTAVVVMASFAVLGNHWAERLPRPTTPSTPPDAIDRDIEAVVGHAESCREKIDVFSQRPQEVVRPLIFPGGGTAPTGGTGPARDPNPYLESMATMAGTLTDKVARDIEAQEAAKLMAAVAQAVSQPPSDTFGRPVPADAPEWAARLMAKFLGDPDIAACSWPQKMGDDAAWSMTLDVTLAGLQTRLMMGELVKRLRAAGVGASVYYLGSHSKGTQRFAFVLSQASVDRILAAPSFASLAS